MLQNKPVVITDFQEHWSIDSFSRKALNNRFGENIVRVSVSPNGRFDGPENGSLWGLSSSLDVLVRCFYPK